MTFHSPEDEDDPSPLSTAISWGVILACIGYLLFYSLSHKTL